MKETYRKRGRVTRWENGTVIRVVESGVAVEDDATFECHPLDEHLDHAEAPDLADVARRVQESVDVRIERLILVHGSAEHEFAGRRWKDETRRLHLSLTNGTVRALVDLAGFDLAEIDPIARALAQAGSESEAPPRLRLAPNVAAALLPSLIGVAPPNVTLSQRAGGTDGKGDAIREATEAWPNWYRPSYRVRPVRMPFNLAATCTVTEIDESLPRAIAILAPPADLTLRVLVVDGARVYPSTVRVARIDAIATAAKWYPYTAGVLGAEIVL